MVLGSGSTVINEDQISGVETWEVLQQGLLSRGQAGCHHSTYLNGAGLEEIRLPLYGNYEYYDINT